MTDPAPSTPRGLLRTGLGVYAASVLGTIWAGRALAGGSHDLPEPIIAAVVASVIPVALYWTMRRAIPWSRVFQVAALVMMAVTLVRLWHGTIRQFPYGDGVTLSEFLKAGYMFPRWLLGLAVTQWIYAGIWKCPPVAAALPVSVQPPYVFAALLCAVVMGVSSFALLRRWPNRLAVVLPMLTPMWVLFSNGHVEYYPLIVAIYVACLVWLYERPLEQRSPWMIGALVGLLPVLYISFTPVAVLIGIVYLVRRPSTILTVLLAMLASAAVAVAVTFPGGVLAFFPALFANLSFGEDGMMYPRYRGHMAGPNSIVLATSYALGSEHVRDVLYMVFWGGGWALVPLLGLAAGAAFRSVVGGRALLRDARVWLGVAVIAWYAYDFLFVPRKMGPAKDVDAFSPDYVMLAFAAGRLLDRAGLSDRRRFILLCALVGVAAGTAAFVAWLWLPRRP